MTFSKKQFNLFFESFRYSSVNWTNFANFLMEKLPNFAVS